MHVEDREVVIIRRDEATDAETPLKCLVQVTTERRGRRVEILAVDCEPIGEAPDGSLVDLLPDEVDLLREAAGDARDDVRREIDDADEAAAEDAAEDAADARRDR